MTTTNTDLDARIAAHLAVTALGDLAWEHTWADLLREKHSKARVPTIAELAVAVSYIEREWRLADGTVSPEQWAEGLAFGRFAGCQDDVRQAEHALPQLTKGQWLRIAERANYLSREQLEAPRYVR